jgi:hypothetical protein
MRCKAGVRSKIYARSVGDDTQIMTKLRAELLALNYPWPKILKDKDQKWLENELKLLKENAPNDKKREIVSDRTRA